MAPLHWDVHPSVAIGLAILAGLYVAVGGLRAPRRQSVAFAAGLFVVFASLNGPLHDLSDRYLFSAHMVQHLVLTMLFPPPLLYGTPPWVMRRLLAPAGSGGRALALALTRPSPPPSRSARSWRSDISPPSTRRRCAITISTSSST
jgi:putative membrane protein